MSTLDWVVESFVDIQRRSSSSCYGVVGRILGAGDVSRVGGLGVGCGSASRIENRLESRVVGALLSLCLLDAIFLDHRLSTLIPR